MEETISTYQASDMLKIAGIIEAPNVIQQSFEGPYLAYYDTKTKYFVFKRDVVPGAYEFFVNCLDGGDLYNDRAKGTIRQDAIYTDGRSVYGYDAGTKGLIKLYDIGEEVVNVMTTTVYPEVYKLTEYAAAKRTDNEGKIYDAATATKYNDEVLDTFFTEAAETADQKLKDFVKCMDTESKTTSYLRRLKYPSRYDTDLWKLAKSSLRSYFIHYVTGRWLQQCGMENTYMELAMNDIADVYTKFAYRTAPKKDAIAGSTEKVKGESGRAAETFTADTGEANHTRRYKGAEAPVNEEPTNTTKKIKG